MMFYILILLWIYTIALSYSLRNNKLNFNKNINNFLFLQNCNTFYYIKKKDIGFEKKNYLLKKTKEYKIYYKKKEINKFINFSSINKITTYTLKFLKAINELRNETNELKNKTNELKNEKNELKNDINKELYKIYDKKNFIKKYEIIKEEVDKYIKEIKKCETSGYEPSFPKNEFKTPDGLSNIILNYKYKNDNLKIHNYYFFFIFFLKKLSENSGNLINLQDFLFLKKKGFFEGETYTWKNWVIFNEGKWTDFIENNDYDILNYEIKSLRKIIEPKIKRMPIKYWGSFRAIDFNINHYPIYKKLYDYFNKNNVIQNEKQYYFQPFIFFPRFNVRRDRDGLGYGDINFFGNYDFKKKKNIEKEIFIKEKNISSNIPKEIYIDPYDFGPNNIKIEEATDIIKYPQTGKLYQKFYIGPLNITDGHTFGSLLKYVCQSQMYGYAIVAFKIHNMNKDTTINNVQEDLLEIALNLSDVWIYSKEINIESNIRLIFKGPLMLVAGMIPLPSHLKIINKEQYICTIKENGFIDISIKIEYGKGHWLTYEKGLYKREIGSDNECMKKREIKEVVDNNYMPISSSFSSCRMVRITVHKIATDYWCEDRCEFTDPKQMLVIEIWCDCRTLPKNVLLFGIKNIQKIFKKLREMIINDVDFTSEEEEKEIKKLWKQIDKYKYLQRKQKEEGGPPIFNLEEELKNQINDFKPNNINEISSNNINQINSNNINPFVQNLIDPENFPKHSNILIPLKETPPPFIDTLEWLKEEVKKEKQKKKKNYKLRTKYKTFDYDAYLDNRLENILDDKQNSKF